MARVKKEYQQIQLDDTYFITSDSMNFVLKKLVDVIDKETEEPTGEKREETVGYFGTNFAWALKRYVIESCVDDNVTDVQKVLDKLEAISKQIDKVVKQENIQLVIKDND
jgi:hypothetical protein